MKSTPALVLSCVLLLTALTGCFQYGTTHNSAPGAQETDIEEIARDPNDVPLPTGRESPAEVSFQLTAKEVTARLEDGSTHTYWTYDGAVPGPMLRAREGDTITITLHNDETGLRPHSLDLHAVTGPGGGAAHLKAMPGESARISFQALQPGLFVYHCATGNAAMHVAKGMYGLILIEPSQPLDAMDGLDPLQNLLSGSLSEAPLQSLLPPVDREFYVMQGELYSDLDPGTNGHHFYDHERALAEDPTHIVFNGRPGALHEPGLRLEAQTGERLRIHFGVGGPGLTSSFHVIGGIFDRVHMEGGFPANHHVQTTLVPAGGATIVDLRFDVPGTYVLVDHSLNRIHKGASALLVVTGDQKEGIYEPAGHDHDHDYRHDHDHKGPDSPLLQPWQSYSHRFDASGNYRYHCHPHPWQTGSIEVQDDEGSGTTHHVTIHDGPTRDDFRYEPAALVIERGDTVVWTNHGPDAHTVSTGEAH